MSSDQGVSKSSGQYHSTKGNLKEAIGNTFRISGWQRKGKEEHAAGETEYNAARTKGYAEGTTERAGGKKDQVVGAVKGDRTQQAGGDVRRQKGQTQQDVNA